MSSHMELMRGLCKTLPILCLVVTYAPAMFISQRETGCGDTRPGQICCGGQLYERDPDRVCCRLNTYNLETRAYVLSKNSVNGRCDTPMETCGDHDFDTRYEGCCGGNTRFRLAATHSCCTGRRMSTVITKGTVCCNGQGLKEGEMCCHISSGPTPLNKTAPTHNECCVPNNISNINTEKHKIRTFDKSTHYCNEERRIVKIPDLPMDLLGLLFPIPTRSSSKTQTDLTSPAPRKPKRIRAESKRNPRKPSEDKSSEVPSPFEIDPKTDCLSGSEEDRGLECCGPTPFRPSEQICCDFVIHNVISTSFQCCGTKAYAKDDPNNPCRRMCGRRPFSTNNQLCCKKKVFEARKDDYCCGAFPVSPDIHDCCGGMPLKRSDRLACCKGNMPYYRDLMNCNNETGSVTLLRHRKRRSPAHSVPRKFCTRTLDTWDERWRPFVDSDMIKVEGRVERCGIRLKGDTLIIPLRPAVAVVGGDSVSRCVREKGLKLMVDLSRQHRCRLTKKQVKTDLKDATLELSVKWGKVRCKRRGAEIRLGDKDLALVLRSRRMDRYLQRASLSGEL